MKTTIEHVKIAFKCLSDLLPDESLALEQWGTKVRIIRADQSRPFGSNYMTKAQAYETIWFAVAALRLQKESVQ